MCYGEGRGVGGVFLLLFGGEAFLRLRVTALGFRWQCLGVTEVPPKSWTGNTLSGNGKSPVLYRALSL